MLVVIALALSRLGASGPAPGDATAAADASAPLTVRTTRVRLQAGYRIARTYMGEVAAARASRLGFELGGKLAQVRVDAGERVEKDAVVARLDTARLRARRRELEAALERAKADRDLAQSTLERVRQAQAKRAASVQRLDEAQQSLAAARAEVKNVAARLDSIDVDLTKSTLRAPYNGIVAKRYVDEGDVVNTGAPVVKLLQRADPEVMIGVAAEAAESLAVGDVHRLRVRGRAMDAAVDAILPERTDSSRTVSVRFVLNGEINGRLRAGDVAELHLHRRVPGRGAWLPMDALVESARGLWSVYTLPGGGDGDAPVEAAIERRDVTVRHHAGERVYVHGALEPGQRVVVTGLHRLVPGLTVRAAGTAPAEHGQQTAGGRAVQ